MKQTSEEIGKDCSRRGFMRSDGCRKVGATI